MRERLFTIQYTLHRTLMDRSGLDLVFTISEGDRGLITATMGRIPRFRSVGLEMLDEARVVAQEGA